MPPKRPLNDSNDGVHSNKLVTTEVDAPQRSSRESKKCNECRRRHVKCDEQRPKCGNCVKTNADCSYSHRGIRYDHISDRQKRDDMYTEIDDISKRVETLLMKLQKEPTYDDVARLALGYGWEVTLAPGGQKQIVTNIETTSQLAALVPNALSEVYVPQQNRSSSQPPLSSSSSSSASSSPASRGYLTLSPQPSTTLSTPISCNRSVKPSSTVKPRKTKRVTLERYVAAYTNPSIHVLNTSIATCPTLFTAIMSPRLLSQFAGHPQLSMLHTSACCTLSLNSCIHNPQGLFTSSTLASFESPEFGTSSVNIPGMNDLNSLGQLASKDLSHYLGVDSHETSLFPPQPRFAECSLANLYWNLLKTAKLLDDGNFSQAYVNLGVMITKAFTLELHCPQGYKQFNTPAEKEAAKRIFWSIWLFDTQMPLIQEGRPTIKLEDITIDKPCSLAEYTNQDTPTNPLALTIEEDDEDIYHTKCLRYLVEVRCIRVQLENTLASFHAWDDEKAILGLIIQQMRMLRRYYEHLDIELKLENYLKDETSSGWKLRAKSILLLEHAMNWLVLFDRFLPLRNEEKPVTPFPANLAVHFCRQAADAMTLVFEKWLSMQNDCQFRWFFSHFVNCLEIHKYIATYSTEHTVHKWKAYASLNFMMYCLREIPVVDLPMGRRVHNDLCQLVVTLRDIVGNCWNPTEEHDLIDSFTKYFSDWRPSFDVMDTNDNGSLFAKESSTMFIILHMQKKGKPPVMAPPPPSSSSILPSTGVTVA